MNRAAMTGAERQFRFVTYSEKTDTTPSHWSLSLQEFYGLLEHEEVDCVMPDGTPGCRGKKWKRPEGKTLLEEESCPQKDGPAWSPGILAEGTTRKNKAVIALDFAVFDVDDLTQAQLEAACAAVEGVEVYLHSTHTHLHKRDSAANINVRFVFPLARTITPAEWKQLWFTIDRKFGLNADKATRDSSRLSFLPRSPRGRPFINVRQEGALLDPDELLRANIRWSREQMRRPVDAGVAPEPEAVDVGSLRGMLKRYSGVDEGMVRRALEGKAFVSRGGQRGHSATVLGSIVGWRFPPNTPVEVALEIVRESFVAAVEPDDPPEQESVEFYSARFTEYYLKAQEEKEARILEEDSAAGLMARVMKNKRERETTTPRPSAPSHSLVVPSLPTQPRIEQASSIAIAAAAAATDVNDDEGSWRHELMVMSVNKQGLAVPRSIATNITVVLENHAAWKGVLRYNELTNEPEMCGGPIEVAKREPERAMVAVYNWFIHNEKFDVSQADIDRHVEFVARGNRYDPVRTYLLGLEHDGVSRNRNWLINYCGARTKDDTGRDVTDYVQTVGEKWLMAAVARGLYPGCKADNVLVFEGDQFAGKSKTLDILGGEWFMDTKLSLQDKTTLELTAKSWIIEMSELASMKKSETEAQKSFFSNRVDHFRLSYARRAGKYKRRCVFAGTTNESQYLLDPTGNRRFWCVWCTLFNIEALRRDRDQIWAEAVAKVRAGETCPNCFGLENRCPEHRWWLDAEETKKVESITNTRLRGDYKEQILAWWQRKAPADRPARLTTMDVLTEILELKADQFERQQQAIGRSMKVLGFEKQQIEVDGHRPRCFVPSEALKKLPQLTRNKAPIPKDQVSTAIANARVPNMPTPKEPM